MSFMFNILIYKELGNINNVLMEISTNLARDSFDYRELLGSFLGVLGAFLVASYQIRKQSKIERRDFSNKLKYDTVVEMIVHIDHFMSNSQEFRHFLHIDQESVDEYSMSAIINEGLARWESMMVSLDRVNGLFTVFSANLDKTEYELVEKLDYFDEGQKAVDVMIELQVLFKRILNFDEKMFKDIEVIQKVIDEKVTSIYTHKVNALLLKDYLLYDMVNGERPIYSQKLIDDYYNRKIIILESRNERLNNLRKEP